MDNKAVAWWLILFRGLWKKKEEKNRTDTRVVVITVHEDEAFAYLEIDE